MIAGMTSRKIAVSLPASQVAEAKAAVADGRAPSVSAYIARALSSQIEREGLRAYVDDLIAEYGAPDSDAYAWADVQLSRATGHPRAE